MLVGVLLPILGPLRTFPVIVATSFSFSVVVLEASSSERTHLLNFAQNLIIIYFFVCFLSFTASETQFLYFV